MPLPEPWVDRIFAKLTVTYGAAWLRMWEGCDLTAVKADWAQELAAYQQNPDAIRFGLENLPEKPPNVLQFRDACRRMPRNDLLNLPLPEPDPAMVAMVKEVFAKAERIAGDKTWARQLKSREEGGERLSLAQRNAWRDALRGEQA